MLDMFDHAKIQPDEIYRKVKEITTPETEAVFVACTQLRALEVLDMLERDLGKPVYSAVQASAWQAFEAMGVDPQIKRLRKPAAGALGSGAHERGSRCAAPRKPRRNSKNEGEHPRFLPEGELWGKIATVADVIVVGGGGAGLAAAAEAARLGRSVILLEKNPQTGGSTSWSVGSVTATNTPHQKRAGIQDSPRGAFRRPRSARGRRSRRATISRCAASWSITRPTCSSG